jgi:hypothetical protein
MDAFRKSQERGSNALQRERSAREAGATTPRTLSTHGVFSEPSYNGVGTARDPAPYDPVGMNKEQFIHEALRHSIAVPFLERTHVDMTVDPSAAPFVSVHASAKGASISPKTFFSYAPLPPPSFDYPAAARVIR